MGIFISALHCHIEDRAAISYMYVPIAGVGGDIKKRLTKYMDWGVSIMVARTINNIVYFIQLNQ